MTTWLAPFLIGLASSLHCMGMCSPLVMAASKTGKHAILRNLQYNAGRILTYSVLGSIASFAGMSLFLAGIQHWVSMGAGILIIAIGVTSIRVAAPAFAQSSIIKVTNALKSQFSRALASRSGFGIILLGMINGILPCGMTLVALGYCITLGSPFEGFIAMIYFGLGTLPAMVGFAWIARRMIAWTRVSYKTIQTTLIIVSGILLIGRGISDIGAKHVHAGTDNEIVVCGPTE